MIEKEKQEFLKHSQPSGKKAKSLAKLLLQQYFLSKEMSEEDIRDQLMTFMIAGQDSTKVSLSWILYLLGLDAAIQAKIHEELDLVFGEDHARHATVEDLKNLKYLDCVIKETLRLYPPIPILARYINNDTEICGYQIPKGTTCLVFPHVLHRDEKVFPNPEAFNPDRFLPENSTTRHPYAYIPFSAGPRNCIGHKLALMELLTVTSTILRRYTVESLDHRDKVLPTLTVALSSSIPLRIRIRPRGTKDK
ncbi:Cytochrome P450 4V2 [Araneus ventricosus]|uniref:Cytochrome P450 4V2 n=1 Tax=Araneus ventricosus TaxID=182803 RepID=A0A4Y2VSI4_ARAVE|nr:Cytochrome P450 4V2 [Araneus ventricosus]